MFRRILSRLHEYILWLLLSMVFWGWIFTMLTDTSPEKKITVFIDAPCEDRVLTLELEKTMPEGIRMVRVHPFTYAMFDEKELTGADLFVVPASRASEYRESFLSPSREALADLGTPWQGEADGPAGLVIYNGETGTGAAESCIGYEAEAPGEDWILFFGVKSLHAARFTGEGDDAALTTARTLLALEMGREPAPTVLAGLTESPKEPGLFLLGVDASCVPSLERGGVTYQNADGEVQDVFQTLAESGVNTIRVRVWNDPFDSQGRGYGGGNCDFANALEIGRRATEQGMGLLVDFHYSDFWADPGKQRPPKAWEGLSPEEKARALYAFTAESLTRLREEGVKITMVQLGNETNGALCGETDWEGILTLMRAGARAVRETCPEALVAVHFTNPERAGSYDFYAQKLAEGELDYDVFASSYYPFWHGTMDNLAAVLEKIHREWGKRVMIVETSYPYTREDSDFFGNTVSAPMGDADWPFTPQGQADYLTALLSCARDIPGCAGVCYWEGTWIAAGGKNWKENSALWERFGSGWASSFAGEYDPEDAGKWYGGCAVDNQALFDSEGRPLPALGVFSAFAEDPDAPRTDPAAVALRGESSRSQFVNIPI